MIFFLQGVSVLKHAASSNVQRVEVSEGSSKFKILALKLDILGQVYLNLLALIRFNTLWCKVLLQQVLSESCSDIT